MARVIQRAQDDHKPAARRREHSIMGSSNRAVQELNVAKTAKTYLDSFFTTLNDAPSMIGTYYAQHIGGTSYSENTNIQKDVKGATKFHKVEDFVIWGQKNQDETEKKEDNERENAIDITDQECIVLQGTIRPLAGDHFVFASQGSLAIPYIVGNVNQTKLVDKTIYTIQLTQSPTFQVDTIEKCVIDTYKFIFGNIGTQRKTLLLKDTYIRLTEVTETLNNLNKMYVEEFYDVKYDLLRMPSTSANQCYIGCKALRDFQHDQEVLTWGENMNTLFVNYPIVTKRDMANFKRSYIYKIMKRKVVKAGETKPANPLAPNCSIVFHSDLELRKDVNEDNLFMLEEDEQEVLETYESEYDYIFDFFYTSQSKFSILTLLRKSGLVLYELNSISPSGRIKDATDPYVRYELDSPIFKKILDLWMAEKYDSILNSTLLDEYVVSNNNIDDYLMIPVIIWVVEMAIAMIEDSEMIKDF